MAAAILLAVILQGPLGFPSMGFRLGAENFAAQGIGFFLFAEPAPVVHLKQQSGVLKVGVREKAFHLALPCRSAGALEPYIGGRSLHISRFRGGGWTQIAIGSRYVSGGGGLRL
ncbi:MAG: hypothetical protein WD696_11520 [Bryobacteraceae bacterium]